MDEITIGGYVPGAIGRVAELHARYYSAAWDFGLFFEAKVASGLSEFMSRFDPDRDGFWTVSRNECIEGAIAIDGAEADTAGAHLRWFILAEGLRGLGLGNRLMMEAVSFCRQHGYRQVYLWTFQGLHPARHLYEKYGFRLAEQTPGRQWGREVLEQQFVLVLS